MAWDSIRQTPKPRFTLRDGQWWCIAGDVFGISKYPAKAYGQWLAAWSWVNIPRWVAKGE